MIKYVAILKEKRAGTLSEALLERHVAHLERLAGEGRLFLCGPFRDGHGAIQILLARSLAEAEALLLADPFVSEGYYGRHEIHELVEANAANNWLMAPTP